MVPEQLKLVVEDLGAFVPRLVFTGGLVLALYFERQPMFRIRPTKDADAVVACATHADYVALQAALGRVGTHPLVGEDDAPICRMVTASGQLLDLMPTQEAILGFGNPWFPLGYETAEPCDIGATQPVRLFPPPVYAAAKAAAYRSRGAGDPSARRNHRRQHRRADPDDAPHPESHCGAPMRPGRMGRDAIAEVLNSSQPRPLTGMRPQSESGLRPLFFSRVSVL